MSNFLIFSNQHLALLLEPFIPGITGHITPIKYEALTPDCFLFLFRTTAQSVDHYFVSLETDFQDSIEGARCTIEDWHDNDIINFIQLFKANDESEDSDINRLKVPTSGPYFAMLAEVGRPTHKGYWAESFIILPGDNIGEKINGYSSKVQANIRAILVNILQHKIDPKTSFSKSLVAIKKDTIVDDINKTTMVVSIFVQPDDNIEYFYNYVNLNKRDRPAK